MNTDVAVNVYLKKKNSSLQHCVRMCVSVCLCEREIVWGCGVRASVLE